MGGDEGKEDNQLPQLVIKASSSRETLGNGTKHVLQK